MVATLIFHSRADLDWATALAGELSEHAPVRLQLTSTPPRATIGPSVVRVALWSDDAAREGTGETFAQLMAAEPRHSILVRRGKCAPPPGIDPGTLADDIAVEGARDAASVLKEAIPQVGALVADIVKSAREKVETREARAYRRADTALLAVVVAALLALGAWQDWGGIRSGLTGAPGAAEQPAG